MFTKIIFNLLFTVTFAASQTSVNFKLSARGLPDMSINDHDPDSYVEVMKAEGTSQHYVIVGETTVINDQNNPNWPEIFNFNYIVGANQRIRFQIWDYDSADADEMGNADISLSRIAGSTGPIDIDIVECGNPNCGQLRILRQ